MLDQMSFRQAVMQSQGTPDLGFAASTPQSDLTLLRLHVEQLATANALKPMPAFPPVVPNGDSARFLCISSQGGRNEVARRPRCGLLE